MIRIVDFEDNGGDSLASPGCCEHKETVAVEANDCSPDRSKTMDGEYNVNFKAV